MAFFLYSSLVSSLVLRSKDFRTFSVASVEVGKGRAIVFIVLHRHHTHCGFAHTDRKMSIHACSIVSMSQLDNLGPLGTHHQSWYFCKTVLESWYSMLHCSRWTQQNNQSWTSKTFQRTHSSYWERVDHGYDFPWRWGRSEHPDILCYCNWGVYTLWCLGRPGGFWEIELRASA